jgi:serine/threonine-protein kinase
VADDLEELANAARQRGRLADAVPAAEESLRIRKAIYGNEHTLVAGSLNNLAVLGALADSGQYDEAGRLLSNALDRLRTAYGTSHSEVAETSHERGELARRRGDLAEAGSRLGEAVAMRRQLLGDRHYLTAKSSAALGAVRLASNDPASAQPLLEDAIADLRRALPESHALVVSATRDLERARDIRNSR